MSDDDDGGWEPLYSNGHWIWDKTKDCLDFVSDFPTECLELVIISNKPPTGTIDFRDDMEIMEQIKFRRRFQRKEKCSPDVITLQDVKDLAFFTAQILSPGLIDLLHLSTTERFIRAFILYCQYYLQVSEEMTSRLIESQTKVPTKNSNMRENELRDNLNDLRILVCKEYSTIIMGGEDTKRFHHMGPNKKSRSLSDRDARLFETLLRMGVQITWLALGRRCFNQIELEVNRLFKTELYNAREHILQTGYIGAMKKDMRRVLLGQSNKAQDKLTVRSPICDAVFSNSIVDYRLCSLGVAKYNRLSPRLKYMLLAIAGPEKTLKENGVTVEILGYTRSDFNTMLQPLTSAFAQDDKSRKLSVASKGSTRSLKKSNTCTSTARRISVTKSTTGTVQQNVYPDIYLPPEFESTDHPPEAVETVSVSTKAPTGTIEFRDDVDVLEQIRFRKRYQRKVPYGAPDVITCQDIKDVALFTAPVQVLSPTLINLLHLTTTERFIRALILYCQYYLQVAEIMALRMVDLDTKIRTPMSEVVESEYRDNLADLRLLVAKEYSTMLIGGSDTAQYHHMGPEKKRRSLSDKDSRLFETLLRVTVQIVWLALERKSFNQIELEVNRIFKTETFNAVEHNLKTGYLAKMTKEEQNTLLGVCVRRKDRMLQTRSPLDNAVFCRRKMNFRVFGLGVIKYLPMSHRLHHMFVAVAAPEELLEKHNVTVGILGIERSKFDTMLHPLPGITDMKGSRSKGSVASSRSSRDTSGASQPGIASGKLTTLQKKSTVIALKAYPDIELPPWEDVDDKYPEHFPDLPDKVSEARNCSKIQRVRWLSRLHRLMHPERNSQDRRKSMPSKSLTRLAEIVRE